MRVRETMIERQKRETDTLREVEGEKTRGERRDACEAVSQHISNEHSDMMWWGRKRVLNSDGCIKYGLPVFPLQSIWLPFYFTFYIKTKDRTRGT